MTVRIRCWSLPGDVREIDGAYLVSADIEANDGRGIFVFTTEPERAMTFPDSIKAFEYVLRSPKCHPIRELDGHPNRPLRGFSTMFETVK